MILPTIFFDLHSIASGRSPLIPIVCGTSAGIAYVLVRGMRLLGYSEARSIMNFAHLGALRCICGGQHQNVARNDRRQFCRGCGCEIAIGDPSLLTRQLSTREIKSITRSLQEAGARASHLELPISVNSLQKLQAYLSSDEPKVYRAATSAVRSAETNPVSRH